MRTVFDACEPRSEVLSGDLRDEMFAARLKDVIEGTADPVYGDARTFFENTYPTDGLRALVQEVLGRLSGHEPSHSPFIRLETSFGGGKTHNLIALYHLAQGHADGLAPGVIDSAWVPSHPWQTAGLVGSDMDPGNGITHGPVTTQTLWGELAYQLGATTSEAAAVAAYEHVRHSDEGLVAPGTQVLEKLLGDGPALIMLDELARYLRAAKAVPTSNRKSDLGSQTVAFLMTLIEYAASKPKICVVVTLADSSDAFSKETDDLKVELGEAKKVSARQERVITPTGETEISKIVSHRLFRAIDLEAAQDTAAAYASYYSELAGQGAEIPQRVLRAEYATEMALDYPFHPELLNTLNRKTATIPNFQKTRGALRLLARVVRQLWEERPADAWVIGVHHLDLGEDGIVNDLTSRLERPAFRSVVEADIVSPKKGSLAHCQSIDHLWTSAGKPPYARRAAINIFLHSLTYGIAAGVDPADLIVSTLQPGDDPQHLRKGLGLMLGEEKGEPGTACWFLHYDGHRYSFKTEPSLEKVIQDELAMVGVVKAKNELDERIRNIWKKGVFRPVYFPAEAADVDDDTQEPKLVIIHYDAAATTTTETGAPELVTKLFDHSGSLQGYRTYKNNLLFLVADTDQVDRMVGVAERFLAIRRITGDADRLAEFTEQHRKQLKNMLEAAELDIRVAITRVYRHLFYPSPDAPRQSGGMAHEPLPAQDQGNIEKDQGAVVLRALKQLDKVLTADDAPMSPAYIKAKAWPHGAVSLATEDLRREFAKRIGLKILLDLSQLKKTIRTGVDTGTWVYYDAEEKLGYGPPSPSPMVQFSEEAILYLPEEAKSRGIRIKGEEISPTPDVCPLCGEFPCVCGEPDHEGGGATPSPVALRVEAQGAPGQAFQQIADAFHDKGVLAAGRLVIKCEGTGKDAAADSRALGLAIPQLGKGGYQVMQTMSAEFSTPSKDEAFRLEFSGGWDRYKRVKQLTDAFGQEATKVNVTTTLIALFADGLEVDSDQFQTMREVFTSLGLGKLTVVAEQASAAGSDL